MRYNTFQLFSTIGDRFEYVRLVAALPSPQRGVRTYEVDVNLKQKWGKLMHLLKNKYTELQFHLPNSCSNHLQYGFENGKLICPAGCMNCEVDVHSRIRACNHNLEYSKEIINNNFKSVWLKDPVLQQFKVPLDVGLCGECSLKSKCLGNCKFLTKLRWQKAPDNRDCLNKYIPEL